MSKLVTIMGCDVTGATDMRNNDNSCALHHPCGMYLKISWQVVVVVVVE